MTMGLYDSEERKGLAHLSVPLADVSDGEYKTFDLGVHNVHAGTYLWIAPPARPDGVQAVFVDRIYRIREKGRPE